MPGVFGKVKIKERLVEETEVEWEITNFLSTIDNFLIYRSPVFNYMKNSWYLELFQRNAVDPDFLTVHLFCGINRKCAIEYSFGLKREDGNVEWLSRCIMPGNIFRSAPWKFIKRLDLHTRLSEIEVSTNFTIICKLQCEAVPPVELIDLDEPEMLKKLDTLSNNLKDLIANKETCDTILYVQDREYKAHRAILIARSSVFAAMFFHETSEKQDGIVNIIDCDPESFGEFLEFLYSGKLHKLSFRNALHLYETSNKYNVEELKTFCQQNLAESLSAENVCDVAIIADKYDDKNLKSAVQKFFNENLHEILDTSGWDSLVKNKYCLSKELLKGMPLKKRKVEH